MRKALLLATASVMAFEGTARAADQQDPPPSAAAAQEAPDTGPRADIIVTAQRRAERIQDVPISITAFSSEQLEARGITEALELIQFVPNLFGSNNTGIGSANAYYLRGLGNTETIATFDPPVGTYVDDIYLSRQNANNLSLFDVERIEVLRGPQGTLFGRNTTGGAVAVIMRRPGDTFGGFAEIGYGRFNMLLGRASVDLPAAPGLSFKVSGYWQDDKGYVRNTVTGDRLNDNDGWGARAAVRAEITPTVRWNASWAYIVSRAENLLDFDCDPANPANCGGRFATTGLREGRRISPSPYLPLAISGRKAEFGLGNHAAQHLVTSNLEFDVAENMTVNLITGYVSLGQQFALDFFDGRGGPSLAVPVPPVRGFPRGGFTIINDGRHRQFTQEVKLNGSLADGFIDFVTGLYYLDEDNETDFADVFSIFTGAPGGTPLLLADRTLDNRTRAYAGYAQADFNVTQEVTLTAGVRYTDEEKVLSFRDNRAICAAAPLPATCLSDPNLIAPSGIPIPRSQRVKIWTPRFAANYQPHRDLLFFVSATRGFKSGGWNARSTAPSQVLPFGPETVWSYEAGLKADFFDRRLRTNLAVYQMDVSDLQTPSALVNPATGAITFLTRNFADYRNRGVEAEISWFPVDALSLFANIGYQKDKYIIDRNAPAIDIYGVTSVAAQQAACRAQLATGAVPGTPQTPACGTGIVTVTGDIATPVRTPDWSLAIGGSYNADLGGGLTLTPAVNAAYRSAYEVQTSNLTFYTGAITGTNGTFPANPFAGQFITGSRAESYWLVNASLALSGDGDRWRLSIECQNCFNERYLQSSLANYSYFNAPGTWTARARVRF
ncbi:MAG: TonB-dependent receptor [Allosphingosinicella sp.]|uniref:TonB-dependent receptor n=1 Tax=Allosphingosinicella sp. TaxID=2823234 RepID=UPI003926B830